MYLCLLCASVCVCGRVCFAELLRFFTPLFTCGYETLYGLLGSTAAIWWCKWEQYKPLPCTALHTSTYGHRAHGIDTGQLHGNLRAAVLILFVFRPPAGRHTFDIKLSDGTWHLKSFTETLNIVRGKRREWRRRERSEFMRVKLK